MTDRHSWRDRAACRRYSPLLWFAEGASEQDQYITSVAVGVCETCPVRLQCLAFALTLEGGATVNGRHGVYGGKTPEQRASVYKRRMERKRKERLRESGNEERSAA